MAFVTKPRYGRNFRITKRGYIDGIFVIDGVRTFKGLGRVADIEHHPSGRPRTAKQLNAEVQQMWEEKRATLESGEEKRRGINRWMRETFDEWLAWAPQNGIGADTVDNHYGLMIRQYLAAVGDHRLDDICIAHVDRFKAWLHERGLGAVTVNMRLTRLLTFLNWARKRGYLKELPAIEKLKVKRKLPRIPNGEQIKALVQRLQRLATTYPNKRQRYHYELHWMELLFVLGCGVRRSGPFYTRWEHVDLDSGVMLMERSKGGEDLLILPGLLVAYLKARRERYPDHVWLFDDGRGNLVYKNPHALTTAFRRHLKELGLADLKIKPLHGFRANFATVSLNDLGVDSRTVATLLNHSSFKTTEQAYLADRAKEKRRALAVFEREYLVGLLDGGMPGIGQDTAPMQART